MGKQDPSRQLSLIAYVFIYFAIMLFVCTCVYTIVDAKFKVGLDNTTQVDAHTVRTILKGTAYLFFGFFPTLGVVFACSAIQLLRIGRKLKAER